MSTKAVQQNFNAYQRGWKPVRRQYVKPSPAAGVMELLRGYVNRLKMLKHQMYGWAGFELLRRRVMSSLAKISPM